MCEHPVGAGLREGAGKREREIGAKRRGEGLGDALKERGRRKNQDPKQIKGLPMKQQFKKEEMVHNHRHI